VTMSNEARQFPAVRGREALLFEYLGEDARALNHGDKGEPALPPSLPPSLPPFFPPFFPPLPSLSFPPYVPLSLPSSLPPFGTDPHSRTYVICRSTSSFPPFFPPSLPPSLLPSDLSLAEIQHYLYELLRALNWTHARGVMHR